MHFPVLPAMPKKRSFVAIPWRAVGMGLRWGQGRVRSHTLIPNPTSGGDKQQPMVWGGPLGGGLLVSAEPHSCPPSCTLVHTSTGGHYKCAGQEWNGQWKEYDDVDVKDVTRAQAKVPIPLATQPPPYHDRLARHRVACAPSHSPLPPHSLGVSKHLDTSLTLDWAHLVVPGGHGNPFACGPF